MGALSQILRDPGLKTIAIVGCSKNSGKTTTLNMVLGDDLGGDPRLGLLSIGIDGEETDFWLGVPKPRVTVRRGWLVASSEKALAASTARTRVEARTGISTPLGELLVARVEAEGLVLLAGVRHKGDVRLLADLMRAAGASRVVIDGAYQRMMAADPDVSDGIVLATGAVLGRTVALVVRKTSDVLVRFLAPAVESDEDARLLATAASSAHLAVRTAGGDVRTLAFGGAALDEAALRAAIGAGDATIAVPGVLTDRTAALLAGGRARCVRVLATDPSRVFAGAATLKKLRARGGDLLVGRAVRLLGISVNPVSVFGHRLPEAALIRGIRDAAPGIPVFATKVGGTDGNEA
jgi:hypothetical protein